MATHSSILAQRILWTEEPGWLQSDMTEVTQHACMHAHASKVMLKILQAKLQQYVNRELPDVQAGFRKGRGTRDQIANICWIIENTRVPEKHLLLLYCQGFPVSSVGKESACNAGDPSLIPGSRRSPGEGRGYLLQYSWASLVAQLVKNLPAMREAYIQSLGCEDPLEKGSHRSGEATHSSILVWRIPWTVQSMCSQSQTGLSNFHFHTCFIDYQSL